MASQYDSFLKQAHDAGYSDDEIRQEMAKSGWKQEDIAGVLPPAAPAQPPQDSFMDESGFHGLGTLLSHGKDVASWALAHPSEAPPASPDLLGQIATGQAQDGRKELGEAWKAFTDPGAAPSFGAALGSATLAVPDVLGHLISAVPFVGHPVGHFLMNAVHGNAPGAIGDMVAMGGPELLKSLGGGAAAESLYRNAIPLGPSMSLDQMHRAAQFGLDQELPAGEKSIARIGNVSRPGTILNDLENQVNTHLRQSPAGAQPVNMNTVLRPVMDDIQEKLLDRTPEGQALAGKMIDEVSGWNKATPTLTTLEAHQMKRAMTKSISESQYSDNSSSIPPAAKAVKQRIAQGLRQGVEENAPEVGPLHQQIQSGIQLSDALTDVAKKRPDVAKNAILWSLGLASGEAATMMGHSSMGMAGLLTLATHQALSNPVVGSRLALALHDVPAVTGALAAIGRPASIAGQAARPIAGAQQDPNLQVQDPLGLINQRLGITPKQ